MPIRRLILSALATVALLACQPPPTADVDPAATTVEPAEPAAPVALEPISGGKPVVYQVLTRLYGNRNSSNRPWGTREENGVGKFDDINDAALRSMRELGVTHVWYTGVLHHALIGNYRAHGISDDDPDVVKGRAGSPYAIKDYYDVNPDLASYVPGRMAEFRALIGRTHAHGMKVLIDLVPNHVARQYRSMRRPDGVEDFGAGDDNSVEYARDNNFYYLPGQAFQVPRWPAGYRPLGGEQHPLADGKFAENPAKWTGNGARVARPAFDDWYETVKINFGVRPDGSYDFDRLPPDYAQRDLAEHQAFWAEREVPDSWRKFRDIALFWLDQGVDGFRYDMAEMVPVEFWSYLNSAIKSARPDAFLLAEVYNPDEYRNYLRLGRMDYLYDKVEFYDSLRLVMQGRGGTDVLAQIQDRHADIEASLLHFLENHDEQRIASPEFAGDAARGRPGMLVSALISRSPTLLYFGQEVGEPASEDAGFGKASRTTIFDYWGVPSHQRWMNDGLFDGGASTPAERELRAWYGALMSFSATQPAMRGAYAEIHRHNRELTPGYDERLFAFVRFSPDQRLLLVANFDPEREVQIELSIPLEVTANWHLEAGSYRLAERLGSGMEAELLVHPEGGVVPLRLPPLAAYAFELVP